MSLSSPKVASYIMMPLSFLLVIATISIFGCYHYWIDDVLIHNYFQGLFLAKPIDHFWTIHVGLSKLYALFYRLMPGVAWVSICTMAYMTIATCYFAILLNDIFWRCFGARPWVSIAAVCVLYFVVWMENVFLLNLTRTSVLMVGMSYLMIHRHAVGGARWPGVKYLLYFTTFLIGLLSRPEVTAMLLPFLFMYSVGALLTDRLSRRNLAVIVVSVIVAFACYKVLDKVTISAADRATRSFVGHVLNVNDGENRPDFDELESRKDKMALVASILYFFPDREILTDDFLQRMSSPETLSWENFKSLDVRKQLLQEYNKARYAYGEGYKHGYNWFWKVVAFLAANLLLWLFSVFQAVRGGMTKKQFTLQTLLFASFLSVAFLITLLFKMEDRVMTPSLIVFSLAHVEFVFGADRLRYMGGRILMILIIVFIVAFIPLRFMQYQNLSAENREELALKKEVIDEIREQFAGKILIYDLWTMSLIHQHPWNVIDLGLQNKHLTYGEHWSNFMPAHLQYLESMCGGTDFLTFYKCLYERRDDVVFVYSEMPRKQMLELYASVLYDEPLHFREIMPDAAINRINKSFFWVDFGYYVFDDSFDDAELDTIVLPPVFQPILE